MIPIQSKLFFLIFFLRNEFGDIYLVTNHMEIDLYKVIRSK